MKRKQPLGMRTSLEAMHCPSTTDAPDGEHRPTFQMSHPPSSSQGRAQVTAKRRPDIAFLSRTEQIRTYVGLRVNPAFTTL